MTRRLGIDAHSALMQFAFNQVCDPADLKGPIDAMVPWDQANVYMQAITFMTATEPTCERVVGSDRRTYAHLKSVGYRMGPAGDH